MGLKIRSPDSHFHYLTLCCLAYFIPPVGLWLELTLLHPQHPTFHSSLEEKLMERPKLGKTVQLLTVLFPAPLGFVSPTKFSLLLSLFQCVVVGCLKKGSNLTVNTSLTITALQPHWDWSPALFYRNSRRITCLVGQRRLGLVQFSSSLCFLLPGLCKDLLGPFRLETLMLR